MHNYLPIAQKIEPELFAKLKAAKRNDRYIHAKGRQNYYYVVPFASRKHTPNRVGQYETLLGIIEDTFMEYCCISGESLGTLSFEVLNFEQVHKLYPNFTKTTAAMFGGGFFKKFGMLQLAD